MLRRRFILLLKKRCTHLKVHYRDLVLSIAEADWKGQKKQQSPKDSVSGGEEQNLFQWCNQWHLFHQTLPCPVKGHVCRPLCPHVWDQTSCHKAMMSAPDETWWNRTDAVIRIIFSDFTELRLSRRPQVGVLFEAPFVISWLLIFLPPHLTLDLWGNLLSKLSLYKLRHATVFPVSASRSLDDILSTLWFLEKFSCPLIR